MKTEITVVKCDHLGEEVIRYPGRLLEEDGERLVVEASFRPEPVQVGPLLLKPGDRFVETYYSDRWYNIYAVYSGEGDTLKGWYCNVTYPPEIGRDQVLYRDLALDLVVDTDGTQEILDEDEFEELVLSVEDRAAARAALQELQERFRQQFED